MASTALPSDSKEDNKPPRRPFCQLQVQEYNSESGPRAMVKKSGGGYECKFIEPVSKHLQSDCPICLLVLREPHMISCCGHNFCETCIGRVLRSGKPCPLCNEPGFTTMTNKSLKRNLDEFQVCCPHQQLGCEWVNELCSLDKHLNTDPQPNSQLEGCPFTLVECVHCKNLMRRHVIAVHQNEHCPKRPYACEYCDDYESTFEDVTHHWAECKYYLLPCPNNCHPSGSGIQRQNLEHHMKEECPLTVVECDLHYVGCGMKLPRKDLIGHMKEESMAHISLLSAENLKLAKRLLERDEKMQQLMQQNIELSKKIDQQQAANQELREELKQAQDTQQRAHQELAYKLGVQIRQLQEREGLTLMSKTVPVDIKMAGFKELKESQTYWFSPPFYTRMCGYKMCLQVFANGNGDGKGTHVSVYTCLMHGEFDYYLMWPFQGDITIQLLNQLEDSEHHTMTIPYSDTTDDDIAGRVTEGEKTDGWGKHQFISHHKINTTKSCQYLKDNCLVFRVLSVIFKI